MLRSVARPSRNANGSLQKLVGHQRDVGGFERGIRAGSPHGNPHIRGRECGSIVDAIAHHRDGPVLAAKRVNGRHFVLREKLGVHLVDAELARERFGRRLIVARQHHDALHALAPQHLHRIPRRFARLIGQGDDAQWLSHARDEHRGSPRRRKHVETGMDLGIAEAAFLDETMVADESTLPADDRFGSAAGD